MSGGFLFEENYGGDQSLQACTYLKFDAMAKNYIIFILL